MLEIRKLRKDFNMRGANVGAVRGIDLDVAPGEFFVLLGPSGCGKTTTLRLIAGLERPTGGMIRIDGETVCEDGSRRFVSPEHRPIGMVFQSYAVWPNMNVWENVAFPLREGVRRLPPDQVRTRVGEMLELLALSELANRPVTTLSGGQQQRVALARALSLRPKVLLMDEPLSNLDFALQVRLRSQIKELMRHLKLTTIYVTHNQAEAMETGDRIAVLQHGRLVQVGTPRDVYCFPVDEFVARFIGEMGLIPATAAGHDETYALLDTAAGRMRARLPRHGKAAVGADCFLGIRPEDIKLVMDGDSIPALENMIEGSIAAARFTGETMIYTARAAGIDLQFKTHHGVELAAGAHVRMVLPADRCVAVMPSADGAEIVPLEDAAPAMEALRA